MFIEKKNTKKYNRKEKKYSSDLFENVNTYDKLFIDRVINIQTAQQLLFI